MPGKLRGHGFRSTLAAQDRIFHREILPAAIAAGRVNIPGFEILDEVLEMVMSVLVEDNVAELNIQDLTRQYAIALAHDSASLEIPDRSFDAFFDIHLLLGCMRDLDVHRTRAFWSDGLREVHRKTHAREDELIFGEVDPVLVADIRPVDSEVDIQHRDGAKPVRAGSSANRMCPSSFETPEAAADVEIRYVVGLLTTARQANVLLLRVDVIDRLIHVNVFDWMRQRLRQTVDAAVLRIDKFRVVSHSFVRQAQRSIDDFFEGRLRNGPAHPVASNVPEILLPELFVVGKHEVLRNAGPERLQNPIVKVFRIAVGASAACSPRSRQHTP